ncbi:MAG: hypothetical protein E1N59_370 [Puniceicoccaceae bacterium 5H]|nr:MAG: hypothetical protein E1N59_370 [Puniceicoccaceae bacterium 5H]
MAWLRLDIPLMSEIDLLPVDMLKEQLKEADQRFPTLTLAMPMAKAGRDSLGNPTRLKHNLQDIERFAEEKNFNLPKNFLEPLQGLLDNYDFWQHQRHGLGIVLNEDSLVVGGLPYEPDEYWAFDRTMRILPFLPLFEQALDAYVLLLAKGHVALYRLHNEQFEKVDVPGMPTSLSEAMKFRENIDNLQVRSQSPTPQVDDPKFYGPGGDEEHQERKIKEFFDRVDAAVCKKINSSNLPLILACLPEHHGRYEKANRYAHLAKSFVDGNPDAKKPAQLAEEAREILRQMRKERLDQIGQQINQEIARGGRGEQDPQQLALDAHFGRVEVCVVDPHFRQNAEIDPEENHVKLLNGEVKAEATDLADYIARETIRNSGHVIAADPHDIPGTRPFAGLLRY